MNIVEIDIVWERKCVSFVNTKLTGLYTVQTTNTALRYPEIKGNTVPEQMVSIRPVLCKRTMAKNGETSSGRLVSKNVVHCYMRIQ